VRGRQEGYDESGAVIPCIVSWLGALGAVLLLILAYTVTRGVVYVLWGWLVGWPVVSGDLGEVFLRLVHLIPALVCGAVAASIGGAINRIDKPALPAALLAFGMASFTISATYD
jgi:hypothetical protein